MTMTNHAEAAPVPAAQPAQMFAFPIGFAASVIDRSAP